MKKSLKITGIVLAVLLAIMIIIPFAFQGKIKDLVKSEGNKMINGSFDFASLNISLFKNFPKASISLKDFWIKGANEFENDTLIQAKELTGVIDLFSLFGDEYDITKVELKDTQLNALVLPDGKANWDIMKEEEDLDDKKEAMEEASSFNIQLKQLIFKNVNIIYDEREGDQWANIHNFNATASGNLAADVTTLKFKGDIEHLSYRMGNLMVLNNANIKAQMDIDADLENNKFTLKDNKIRLNAIEADLDGWIALLDDATDMDIKLNTNKVGFKEILSLVPAIYATDFKKLKTEGEASLTAFAKGKLADTILPNFEAEIKVDNAQFQYPALPAGVDQINVHAIIKNPGGNADLTEIAIQPFSFRMAGNPFHLTANIKTPMSDPAFSAKAKGTIDLGVIEQVYPLDDMNLNGIINADLDLTGKMSYIDNEQYDKILASGNIKLSDMKLMLTDMPEVNIDRSTLTFTPKHLILSETTALIGKSDITLDSRLENYLSYIFKNEKITGSVNLRSNHLNLNDFIAPDENTASQEEDSVSLEAFDVPENINFTMTANLKEVLLSTMKFNNVQGNLRINNQKIDMNNLSLNGMGGSIVMNAYYSTAISSTTPKVAGNFNLKDLSFTETYQALDMVKQLAPVFDKLKGSFSGELKLETLLNEELSPMFESTQGKGKLTTRNLSLSDVDVIDQIATAIKKPELKNMQAKDLDLAFEIENGRLSTEPFDVKLGDYVMNLSGSTGLDQTIDYSGKIKLPATAGKIGDFTTLDLKIGGTFQSPSIGIDAESMAKQAVDKLADKAKDKLSEKLGLNKDSTQVNDSTKTEVEDASIEEKATEKAFDFLKKKLKK
ncbi:MAG: AsmA-like C-terminal region-containing protein [Bacteroides sp.]|nr:AsmA-like C-terminal region-containing protein [Bacteroides sp.]